MSKPLAKADRARAERAAEHWAVEEFGAVSTVRAVRTQWQRQDLFGADVLALDAAGRLIAIQVTAAVASGNIADRRRKLERHPWDDEARVIVAQLRASPDPANRRRIVYHFRVHEWDGIVDACSGGWRVWDKAPEIPREWFKARAPSIGMSG